MIQHNDNQKKNEFLFGSHTLDRNSYKHTNTKFGYYVDNHSTFSILKYLIKRHKLNSNNLLYFKKHNRLDSASTEAISCYLASINKIGTSKNNISGLTRISVNSKKDMVAINGDKYLVKYRVHHKRILEKPLDSVNSLLKGELKELAIGGLLKSQSRIENKAILELSHNLTYKQSLDNSDSIVPSTILCNSE